MVHPGCRPLEAQGHIDPPRLIHTERLRLIPASPGLIRAALDGPQSLATSLGAEIPATWPPEFLDSADFKFALDRLSEGPEQAGWWLYFVLINPERGAATLIGSAGYKGPPSSDGTVEVGYGIVSDQRRRGYASEVVRGLLARAFVVAGVGRAIAETLPELVGSIGVLRKCGFTLIGVGSEPGVIRFELTRASYLGLAADASGRAMGSESPSGKAP